MKIVKILTAAIVLSGALVAPAQAHDSFSVGINVGGGYDYAPHTIRTHRNVNSYYGGYYRSAPRVIYYAPQIRYRHVRSGRHFRGGSYFGNRDFGHVQRNRQHYSGKRYDRNERRHNRRGDNRGRVSRKTWR
jgi:hypothetical protein